MIPHSRGYAAGIPLNVVGTGLIGRRMRRDEFQPRPPETEAEVQARQAAVDAGLKRLFEQKGLGR